MLRIVCYISNLVNETIVGFGQQSTYLHLLIYILTNHFMNTLLYSSISIIALCLGFPVNTSTNSSNIVATENLACLLAENRLSESSCTTNFNGEVTTYTLEDGSSHVGQSIWISRKSGRVKAKYFAHKQNGSHVHHRYTMWRVNDDSKKEIILKSSGAYATGWNGSDIPVGVTVDNGIIVNRNYHDEMDGLVIVYATGGIAVSNIEEGDLYLESLNRKVNITNAYDRSNFLSWAEKEEATVFQMHLMAYKNEIKVGKYNSSSSTAKRKFLVLAKNTDGDLFHIIFYLNKRSYTLYKATELVFNYLKDTKDMNVIAMINLDTGGYDILNTAGTVTDCKDDNVWGSSNNYDNMTNLLTYHYE